MAHALGRYAERLHARAGNDQHVVSPLGAWMVIALCASAAGDIRDREALAQVLGADPDAACQLAASLLVDPHPLVATAAGLWLDSSAETPQFKTWRESLPVVVDTGDLPTQTELDAWATERTLGLIERFPMEITPTLVCLLASVLATKVSWEVPFEIVDAAELGPSRWSGALHSVLRAPSGTPRHRQFLAKSGRAGTVCVHLAQARRGLLVGSVIAVDENVAMGDVLAVAEEIVTAEPRQRVSYPRLSLFDMALGDGPLWSLDEEPVPGGGRVERVISILPAWRATTAMDLSGDRALGFDDAARIIASVLELPRLKYEARQECVARYSAIGFEAAAITLLGYPGGIGVPRTPGVRRTATVRFAHPYAVVAVAFDADFIPGSSESPTPWHGLPVFSAWVTDPGDAE